MKVVLNKCYGGFCLSQAAYKFLGLEWDGFGFAYGDKRTDKNLVECVETLGSIANGKYSNLRVVEIPDYIEWAIENYYGIETIHEKT